MRLGQHGVVAHARGCRGAVARGVGRRRGRCILHVERRKAWESSHLFNKKIEGILLGNDPEDGDTKKPINLDPDLNDF